MNHWRNEKTAEELQKHDVAPQANPHNCWKTSRAPSFLFTQTPKRDGSRIFSSILPLSHNPSHLSSFISPKLLVSLLRSTDKAHSVPLEPISLCGSPAAALAAPRRLRVKEAVRRGKQSAVFRGGTIRRASRSVTNRTAAALINTKRGPWADCLMSCHDCKPNYLNGR